MKTKLCTLFLALNLIWFAGLWSTLIMLAIGAVYGAACYWAGRDDERTVREFERMDGDL